MLVVGLAVAHEYDIEWLRIATIAIAPVLAGLAVMVAKTRSQRRNRSREAGSVERAEDERASAGAFIDAMVLAAVAVAVGALAPGTPAWLLPLLLMIGFLIAYGVRYWWGGSRGGHETHASHQQRS